MADYFKQEGRYIDCNYVVETGTTVTAGSMMWVDISGTNVIHPVTSLANSSGFVGILTETLTGPHTGCTLATEGVYRMCVGASTTNAWTGGVATPLIPVWATLPQEVQPDGLTAATLTGYNPVGILIHMQSGTPSVSGAANTGAYVKIYPFKQLEAMK